MDDGSPIGLIVLFLVCLGFSFLFSATETAFSTVNHVRLRAHAAKGDKRAARALAILSDYDRALTTILIGNNIANISMATIATILAMGWWGASAVTLVTLAVTLIVFLFAETLPKTLAKAGSESFSMKAAGSLSFLMKALRPLVAVFSSIATLSKKPFRGKQPLPTVTEEELRDLLEDAVEDGALNEETSMLVQSAIRYTDATARDILTPWQQIRKLPMDTPHEEVLTIIRRTPHSRMPVIDKSGEVAGLLLVRKYLKATLRGNAPQSVEMLMEPMHRIPQTMPVDDLLPMMSRDKTHFMLVMGDEGDVLGVVTVEDIIERLVGDIWDEDDMPAVEGGDA